MGSATTIAARAAGHGSINFIAITFNGGHAPVLCVLFSVPLGPRSKNDLSGRRITLLISIAWIIPHDPVVFPGNSTGSCEKVR